MANGAIICRLLHSTKFSLKNEMSSNEPTAKTHLEM
jgi:hypothetical protein